MNNLAPHSVEAIMRICCWLQAPGAEAMATQDRCDSRLASWATGVMYVRRLSISAWSEEYRELANRANPSRYSHTVSGENEVTSV